MQRGVDAHALETALPVEDGAHRLAGLRRGLAVQRHMQDAATVLRIIDCAADRDRGAVGPAQQAGIAGLAATGGVEDRLVQFDAAALIDRQHGGGGLGEIGVVAEEQGGGHRSRTLENRPGSRAGGIGMAWRDCTDPGAHATARWCGRSASVTTEEGFRPPGASPT